MDLIYFVIGASVIPLLDVIFAKAPRTLIQYGIYVGWWSGLWITYIGSVVFFP